MPYYFPFKKLQAYKVIKTFKCLRSGDVFNEGTEIIYLDSVTNHYDEIEICKFVTRNSNLALTWHAHQDLDLTENWKNFLEKI